MYTDPSGYAIQDFYLGWHNANFAGGGSEANNHGPDYTPYYTFGSTFGRWSLYSHNWQNPFSGLNNAYYHLGGGTYVNGYGKRVSFDEVRDNYLIPKSRSVVITGKLAQSFFKDLVNKYSSKKNMNTRSLLASLGGFCDICQFENSSVVGDGYASSSLLMKLAYWYDALYRMNNNMPADAYSISGNVDIVGILGNDTSFPGKLWVTEGNDRGMSTYMFDFGVALGVDLGISVAFTAYYYVGDINVMKIGDFEGARFSGTIGFSFGVEIGGGYMVATIPGKGYIIAKTGYIGISPPGPSGNINWGGTIFY